MNWNFLVTESKNPRNRIVFGVLLAALFLGAVFLTSTRQNAVNKNTLESYSSYEKSGNTASLFLSSKDRLFQMKKKGEGGVKDFLNSNFKDQNGARLFPDKYGDDAILIRTKQDILSKKDHYIYQQHIKGIPVFGGEIGVHVKDEAVYALDGKILYDDQVPKPILTRDDAKKKALQRAHDQTDVNVDAEVVSETIINKKLLGTSTDEKNYLTFRVLVESDSKDGTFSKFFYIDAVSGEILMEESNIFDAMNRIVSDCGGSRSCRVVRSEGQPASGISEADNLYSILGEIYVFYKDRYGRDSVDGRGSALKGNTNMNPVSLPCPNADFNSISLTMSYCPRMVMKDVSMHEFTHGAISTTAGLAYQDQYGALNEAIADIFASNIDGNWTLGEGSILGVIRDLSNPPSVSRTPQPDRLFHSLYYCGYDQGAYVHINSGVVNKAYFLMTDGGKFNGCEMSGIGRDRSIDIVYQALTTYLRPTSNFKDFYSAMLQACGDKFPSEPAVCENVKRAMEAVEIDQQPTGSATSPKCSGKAAATATCASGGVPPTVPPAPSGTQQPSPTDSVGGPTPTPIEQRVGGWLLKATPVRSGSAASINYEYEIPDGKQGVIVTYVKSRFDALDPLLYGMVDASYGPPVSVFPSGKGSYIARGNVDSNPPLKINVRVDPPIGLKCNETYVAVVYDVAESDADPTKNVGSAFFLKIDNIKTPSCSVAVPTAKPDSTVPTGTPGPSPTPRELFTCVPDPKCIKSGKSIQLCPLVCQSMSSGQPNPTQSPSNPTGTGAPRSTSPTAIPPTGTNPTVTTVLTPTGATSGVKATIDAISEQKIREYLANLVGKNTPGDNFQTRYSCSSGNEDERNYIKDQLAVLGLAVEEQSFSAGSCTTKNIVARYDGKNKNSVYMVTAHMDSTAQRSGTNDPSPGADDNGSGTTAVMEIARAIATVKPTLEHSIEFVLFSGEEQNLYGSKYYANNFGTKTLMGLMNLDMIGISSGGKACVDFTYGSGGLGSAFTARVVDTNTRYNIGLEARSILSVIPYSDHYPFQAKGKQAAFGYECVIDSTLASPIYHSLNDKIENINFDQITKTAKAVAGAVVDLADE